MYDTNKTRQKCKIEAIKVLIASFSKNKKKLNFLIGPLITKINMLILPTNINAAFNFFGKIRMINFIPIIETIVIEMKLNGNKQLKKLDNINKTKKITKLVIVILKSLTEANVMPNINSGKCPMAFPKMGNVSFSAIGNDI